MLVAIFFFITSLQAKIFQNSYVSFELPDRWECKLEGTEWVCHSLLKEQAREAIIVLTAKEIGPTDTLEAYEAHLKQPKTIPSQAGKPTTSQIKSLQRRQINGHVWVDSMHLGSEVPQYYTRYLATVKERLAILVTFSAHQTHFTKYSSDILKAVQSLRVTAQFSLNKQTSPAPTNHETIGSAVPIPIGEAFTDYPPEPKASGGARKLLALLIFIAAIGGYIYMKKRRKP